MIKTKSELAYFLEADRIALGRRKKDLLTKITNFFSPDYVWMFQIALRELEYMHNNNKSIFVKYLTLRKFNKLSIKLGFSIPINVFGPGLSIAHYGTIIINTGAKIGANCRLHACVNIGTEAGFADKAPTIGNYVYIGPGAKIFGDITIADGVMIGANSVVNKTFNEPNIIIAGVPAKKIKDIAK